MFFGKFKSLGENIINAAEQRNAIISTILQDNDIEADLINLNQKQLYDKGIEADGTPTGQYTKSTKASKYAYGERYDHITLRDTGYFYSTIHPVAQSDYFVMSGDTEKPDGDLTDRWANALGLTNDSLMEFLGMGFKDLFIIEFKNRIFA